MTPLPYKPEGAGAVLANVGASRYRSADDKRIIRSSEMNLPYTGQIVLFTRIHEGEEEILPAIVLAVNIPFRSDCGPVTVDLQVFRQDQSFWEPKVQHSGTYLPRTWTETRP